MRHTPALLALLATAVILPVTAFSQMPTTAPGAKDASRVKAGTYAVDGSHTQIMWRVNHLGFNDYFGLFGDAKGSLTIDPAKPAAAKLEISIPIASIGTSSAKLTENLLGDNFFSATKFPEAKFVSTSVAVNGEAAKISGNLTIKGVTKPVVLDATFAGAGVGPMNKKETIAFHAKTSIKRSDFGVSYGIPLVPDEVPLKISVAFEKSA